MKDSFYEIIERMGQPLFHNIHGSPHYRIGNHIGRAHIRKYFRKIACQECKEEFIVEMCDPIYASSSRNLDNYGDPPRHGSQTLHGCWAGDTMSSDMIGKLNENEIKMLLKSKKASENAGISASGNLTDGKRESRRPLKDETANSPSNPAPENANDECDCKYEPLERKPEKPKATRKNCGSSSSSKAALLPTKRTYEKWRRI